MNYWRIGVPPIFGTRFCFTSCGSPNIEEAMVAWNSPWCRVLLSFPCASTPSPPQVWSPYPEMEVWSPCPERNSNEWWKTERDGGMEPLPWEKLKWIENERGGGRERESLRKYRVVTMFSSGDNPYWKVEKGKVLFKQNGLIKWSLSQKILQMSTTWWWTSWTWWCLKKLWNHCSIVMINILQVIKTSFLYRPLSCRCFILIKVTWMTCTLVVWHCSHAQCPLQQIGNVDGPFSIIYGKVRKIC